MRRLFLLIFALLGPLPAAQAQLGTLQGFCEQGATSAQTQGLASTNRLQGIIPSCTVTVYLTGTQTLATIYSDASSTPLTNPFTASAIGQWKAYASGTNQYDVILSGGIAPDVYATPVAVITAGGVAGNYVPLAGGTMYGELFAPNINGEVYPASCGDSSPPSWCTGTTADAWIRAACTQLPAKGGFINLLGLSGTLANSVPCSTPTKQVIFLQDPTQSLLVTENDGGVVFPLDNTSMWLGPGAGQCIFNYNTHVTNGVSLDPTANVMAIVGPAHTDSTQQDFTVQGGCFIGASGATVGKGLIYDKATFVNTTISENLAQICPTACMWIENVGGQVEVYDNELDPTSGVYTLSGSGLVLVSTGSSGCENQSINIHGGNIEHANGGANYPEISILGNGSGAFGCGIYIHDIYTEKGNQGTPSTVGIQIKDCWHCAFTNIYGGGGSGTSGDLIKITASNPEWVSNVTFNNIGNFFGTWTNTINDTTSTGSVLPGASFPFVTTYYSNPGYVQPPVLPGSTLQSLGTDILGGIGSFATGSGTVGTGFETACSTGLTCVYTRTNSAPPPGYTFSQEVQITANADASSGFNGVVTSAPVSFTAGQQYSATFWGKGDGSFAGFPTYLLWISSTSTIYCTSGSPAVFSTSWTLYSFSCTPTSSGTANLQLAARTPIGGQPGATGTFWVGGFIFAPIQPMSPNNILSSVGPYGVGVATTGQKTVTVNGAACVLGSTCTVSGATTGTTGTITGTSLSGTCDSGTATATGAVVGHPVAVSSTTGADVGAAFNVRGSVTSTNIVTVYICGTGTPASLAYNVTVF